MSVSYSMLTTSSWQSKALIMAATVTFLSLLLPKPAPCDSENWNFLTFNSVDWKVFIRSRFYCGPITYILKLIILCFNIDKLIVKHSWKHTCNLDKCLHCVIYCSNDMHYNHFLKYPKFTLFIYIHIMIRY